MKKTVLFFLTSITSIWFIDLVLSGFVFKGGPITSFLIALFMIVGIFVSDWLAEKLGNKSITVIFILGILVNFFSLYLASQFIKDFSISAGSLKWLNIDLIKSMDQILMLLIGSLVTTVVSTLTRWASNSD